MRNYLMLLAFVLIVSGTFANAENEFDSSKHYIEISGEVFNETTKPWCFRTELIDAGFDEKIKCDYNEEKGTCACEFETDAFVSPNSIFNLDSAIDKITEQHNIELDKLNQDTIVLKVFLVMFFFICGIGYAFSIATFVYFTLIYPRWYYLPGGDLF